MKEIVNFFAGRRYSAVNTAEMQMMGDGQKTRKSLQTKPALNRGVSVLDALFHDRKSGKRTRWPKSLFFLLTSGLLLVCLGIFVIILQPYDFIFKWKLLFSEDGEIFQLWERPPVDLHLKVYLFNITNHEEFLAGRDKKLNVEEIGPYVYKELLSHENVTFNDNGTLTTIPHHPLEWREELSEGRSEDDILYLPNIALLSIAHVAAQRNYFFRLPINLVIRNTNSQAIVKMTAKEFMFGFESPLTTLGNTLLPHWIHFDRVGLIDRMYDFTGDFETFFTGETDPSISGLYDTFRGSTDLPHWEGKHCSNIQTASDGTKFKSFIKNNETLLFFRKSMCRPQRLKRVGDTVDSVQGLAAIRYQFEENALDNGIHNEANKCFCRNGNCLAEGLSDVTDCYYGFPIALSYPHFLDADPALLENVTGSTPNRSEHESFFILNPTSGLPLRLSAKFQINLAMSDVKTMAHVEQFSHLTIPMLWFEIGLMELPERLEKRFSLYLNILPVMEKAALYGLLALGSILSIIAVSQVALRTSKTLASQKCHQKFNRNLIYAPCEEKLIDEKSKKPQKVTVRFEDQESNSSDCADVITRHDQYELEDDDALSDIDYSETQIDEESASTSSEPIEVQQPERSRQNSLIDIELPCSSSSNIDKSDNGFKPHMLSPDHLEDVSSGARRGSMLRIIETDDES